MNSLGAFLQGKKRSKSGKCSVWWVVGYGLFLYSYVEMIKYMVADYKRSTIS